MLCTSFKKDKADEYKKEFVVKKYMYFLAIYKTRNILQNE